LFQYCHAGKNTVITFTGKAVPALVPLSLSHRNQEVLKKKLKIRLLK
jgi:antitoxin (DNA-binding transcriptional repressor) of toxin-antitoxin stability system